MSEPVAITRELLESLPLPLHGDDDDKDARGKVLVIAGSRPVPGAALLAAVAALRAGAGKLQIATVEGVAGLLGLTVPEALCIALPETTDGDIAARGAADILIRKLDHCNAALIGPGMLDPGEAAALTAALVAVECDTRVVVDAGAMTDLLPRRDEVARAGPRLVFTPHAGEMAYLTGETREAIAEDPLRVVREAAAMWNATMVLKGGCTRIAASDGRTWLYTGGNVGLATSGSGDTLAGVIAGLLARGCEPHVAAIWGVWLHGEAGNRLSQAHGPVGFLARELLAEVPRLMAGLGPNEKGPASPPGLPLSEPNAG